jgi:hypothetical protein
MAFKNSTRKVVNKMSKLKHYVGSFCFDLFKNKKKTGGKLNKCLDVY